MKPAALAQSSKLFPPLKFDPPFSNFDFVKEHFGGEADTEHFDEPVAIRRLFSQARSHGAKTLLVEDIEAEGVLQAENAEIRRYFPDHRMGGLKRLSFWKRPVTSRADLTKLRSRHLVGYLVAKKDLVPSRKLKRWHVFESVFIKYKHVNNCVPRQIVYPVEVAGRQFKIRGVLYGQQNELNKACAQVALRSLLSLHIPLGDLSFDRINAFAAKGRSNFTPSDGLDAQAIRNVLSGFGIGFTDIDYSQHKKAVREDFPYQKLVYAGVESGGGALVGFRMATPKDAEHHVVAVFGHTFNQDTWVANAASAYFEIGETTRYIPSETWLSSFIGHDDNFGSNFCVPRLYVAPKAVQYALAILPRGVRYDGVWAESIASDYLYSLQRSLSRVSSSNRWVRRLLCWASNQKIVLRAVAATKEEYLRHLSRIHDWHGDAEHKSLLGVFQTFLKDHVWVVEISLPELFPINRRKLGEIVLDATTKPKSQRDYAAFIFARLPGNYFFIRKFDKNGQPAFVSLPSPMKTHTPLLLKRG